MAGVSDGAGVARARDLARTRAMPAHMLTDGEIGNEVRDGGTTAERREALEAEAASRREFRSSGPLTDGALNVIWSRAARAGRDGP